MKRLILLLFVIILVLTFCGISETAERRIKRTGRPVPQQTTGVPGLGISDDLDTWTLENYISNYMESCHIPGLSAAVSKFGQVIWTGAFGDANFQYGFKVNENTLFMLASITKTVTGTTLAMLYEEGKFGLDDPVNNYLPFQVVHPKHPGIDITFRMLYTHTSGIKDNWSVMPYYPGDSPIPLGTYLQEYLTPGGAYYNPTKNFTNWAPGTNDTYCNIAVALLGYLVETISGQDLESYCQQKLLLPLGMNETSYFYANLDPSHMAMPYYWNGAKYVAYGHYGYSDYPSGQMRTSATQLVHFLTTFMLNRYPVSSHGNYRILDSETVNLMLTPQNPSINPNQGLIWYHLSLGGRSLWGHSGGDQGVSTEMWYCPDEESGVVVLINGETFIGSIVDACFDYAENK